MSWQCPECGNTNDDSNLRCVCGRELDTPHGESSEAAIDKTSQQMVLAPMENFNERGARAFIGKEADYYLKKWQPILEGRGRWAGFNWAAFFLTGLWLAYRKMYKKSFIFYGMILIGVILEEVFFVGVLEKPKYLVVLDKLYTIVLSVICGVFGNIWYLSHTRKVIYEFRSQGLKEEAYFQLLSKRGGTNLKKSLGLFVLFLLAAIIVAMAIALFPLLGMLFCYH